MCVSFSLSIRREETNVIARILLALMRDSLGGIYESLSSALIDHHQSGIIQTGASQFISGSVLPATSDRIRVDRKFNCVTRQRPRSTRVRLYLSPVPSPTPPLLACVVTARNYRPMRRSTVDPEDHLFPAVYLNLKELSLSLAELTRERTDRESNVSNRRGFGSSGSRAIKLVCSVLFLSRLTGIRFF